MKARVRARVRLCGYLGCLMMKARVRLCPPCLCYVIKRQAMIT